MPSELWKLLYAFRRLVQIEVLPQEYKTYKEPITHYNYANVILLYGPRSCGNKINKKKKKWTVVEDQKTLQTVK
jgi:hypothetical protein